MSTKQKLGPNGKPGRPFVLPNSIWGKLLIWRLMLYRRMVQIGTLMIFFGSAHWGWELFGSPVLRGNLSASELLGVVPLADPFATLQIFVTGHVLHTDVILGATIIGVIYFILGARVWCSWVCPINMVTDLAGWIRKKLNIKSSFRLHANFRYLILVLSLLISFFVGVAAFEWVSPISIFHRELIFGLGIGWAAILGIFLIDVFILKHGWCGYLCPLGAFYALLGKYSSLRIRFDSPTCTHCVECVKVCPEPPVFDFKKAEKTGMIDFGACSNCGRCISVCPEGSLRFDLRHYIKKAGKNPSEKIRIIPNTQEPVRE